MVAYLRPAALQITLGAMRRSLIVALGGILRKSNVPDDVYKDIWKGLAMLENVQLRENEFAYKAAINLSQLTAGERKILSEAFVSHIEGTRIVKNLLLKTRHNSGPKWTCLTLEKELF